MVRPGSCLDLAGVRGELKRVLGVAEVRQVDAAQHRQAPGALLSVDSSAAIDDLSRTRLFMVRESVGGPSSENQT